MLISNATRMRACSASSGISKTYPVNANLRHISIGSHQKAKTEKSPQRNAVARLSDEGVCLRMASRLAQSSTAYSRGIPTGQTAMNANATPRVD